MLFVVKGILLHKLIHLLKGQIKAGPKLESITAISNRTKCVNNCASTEYSHPDLLEGTREGTGACQNKSSKLIYARMFTLKVQDKKTDGLGETSVLLTDSHKAIF